MVSLSLLASGAGRAVGSSGDRLITASLIELGSHSHALDFSGESVGEEAGFYLVNVGLHWVPCRGLYRYVAYGEDFTNGVSTTFDSYVRVRRYRSAPPGLPCHRALPPRTGQGGALVRLTGPAGDLLTFKAADREPDGSFEALLDLGTNPGCDETYIFSAQFVNPRSRRSYHYQFEVLSATAVLDGMAVGVRSCPPADPPR